MGTKHKIHDNKNDNKDIEEELLNLDQNNEELKDKTILDEEPIINSKNNEDNTNLDNKLKYEDSKCIEALARSMADFDNFKKRVERDREDMIFFIKSDILKKILPRIDDLERIIKNSKEEDKNTLIYEAIISLHKSFVADIEKLGIKSFKSIGEKINPDLHDVMTSVIGTEDGLIIEEFEKGYMIGDRLLRHAKVVASVLE